MASSLRRKFFTAFAFLSAAAAAHAGTIYAAESVNIYAYTSAGVRTTFAAGVGNIWSLVADSGGNVFAGDRDGHQILKITSAGVSSIFASGIDFPFGMALDAQGNLFASSFGDGNVQGRNIHFQAPAIVKSRP